MFAIKNILKALTLIMAIIGFIFLILLLLGYRLIIESDTKPDWEAISTIATIFAVITALFITKWQDLLNNRKILKIQWLHSETSRAKSITFLENKGERRIDEICIRFINRGNRKIVLTGAYIEFPAKLKNFLVPDFIASNGVQPTMSFPCELEPEMVSQLTIPYSSFSTAVHKFMDDGHIKDTDDIIIIATDTVEKKYPYNTKIKYSTYLK